MNDLADLARAACDAWTRGGATHADLSAAMHDLHAAVASRKVAVQLAAGASREVRVTTTDPLPSGPLPLPVVSQNGDRITVTVPPGAEVLIQLQTLPVTRAAEHLPFDRDGKPRQEVGGMSRRRAVEAHKALTAAIPTLPVPLRRAAASTAGGIEAYIASVDLPFDADGKPRRQEVAE